MRVGRTLVDDFVEIEEAGIGDALLAEGLQATAAIIGEEPAGAEGDGARCCGDLAWRVLLQRGLQFGGGNEVGGEGVRARRQIEERMAALWSVEGGGTNSSKHEGSCRHGVLSFLAVIGSS